MKSLLCVAVSVVFSWVAVAARTELPDDPAYDLRPSFSFACRVRFDRTEGPRGGWATVVQKGNPYLPGSYWLRASRSPEKPSIDFFVNLGGGPEPRVHSGVKPVAGRWYDLAAGWDGTNAWLSVDGKVTRTRRTGTAEPLAASPVVGDLEGEVTALRFVPGASRPGAACVVPGASRPGAALPDTDLAPGFVLGCDVMLEQPPRGLTELVKLDRQYMLRYDLEHGRRAFDFFVMLDGQWERRVSVSVDAVTGRVYRVIAGWDGLEATLSVDGEQAKPVPRRGVLAKAVGKLRVGNPGRARVTNLALRNPHRPRLVLDELRTREFLPRLGRPVTLLGEVVNCGVRSGDWTIEATANGGAKITPAVRELKPLEMNEARPLAWTIDAGTNGAISVTFVIRSPERVEVRKVKFVSLLPAQDPDLSAKAWTPPVNPTRTYHVDSAAGDDARDGLTPATAWRTLARAKGLTLAPGERLLLKRGSVFNEELTLKAAGADGNWAEIGAYGDGMRPQIRRNRDINERCGFVDEPRYLVIRDLVFCNAGSGFTVLDGRHVLFERCLAHHIEGLYRFNSHGIPAWRDQPGPGGKSGSRSCGIGAVGVNGRHLVFRDCESYQCSSGFNMSGADTFVTRMFCHDNYAHNTSPHPYNISSRAWMTDSVFDASGWHAAAGTMGVMLAANEGLVIRNCHFLNLPDSGSHDQGGIDFENRGENCLIDRCTFRNNAGAAIEVLGLQTPQTRNVWIRGCRFDRNNYGRKNGPAEISVWGSAATPHAIACSNGIIEENAYVTLPDVPFYRNDATATTNGWRLSRNRAFDFAADMDRALPWGDPPALDVCGEVWTDRPEAALEAHVAFRSADKAAKTSVAWEQVEGRPGFTFAAGPGASARATLPGEGDYRVQVRADDGTFWRTARTAVHVLPAGATTCKAWTFSKNLDSEGWTPESLGTDYEYIQGKTSFWDSRSYPVHLVCGDYYVLAMKPSAGREATYPGRPAPVPAIVSPDDLDVGIIFSPERCNVIRLKLQNHTDSRRMRLWWQTYQTPAWTEANSVAFDVKPHDADDSLYAVPVPRAGQIKRLKLAFSADGGPVTGTCRIDYIWAGHVTSGTPGRDD